MVQLLFCVPRSRSHLKTDLIVEAATWAFSQYGFGRAKVHQVADRAGVGPGTVYLYAQDKEALFELAMLRALESPSVAHPELPYPKTKPDSRRRLIDDCLHEIANFPQLWVGSQRREQDGSVAEFVGILLELSRWLRRYRTAILLAERNRIDWPDLAEGFDQIVWADLLRRLAGYVGVRMRGGALNPVGDPNLVARFLIDALVGSLVMSPIRGPGPDRPGDEDALIRLVAAVQPGESEGAADQRVMQMAAAVQPLLPAYVPD